MLDLEELIKSATGRDTIGRDASSLTTEQWQAIDEETIAVVEQAPHALDIFAPLIDRSFAGAGWTEIKTYSRGTRSAAVIDMSGDPVQGDYTSKTPNLTPVPITHAETLFRWRMLEQARKGLGNFETEEVATAGNEVLKKNDDLIFGGDAPLGVDSLIRPTGYTTSAGSSWSAGAGAGQTNAYADVLAMNQALDDIGAVGPRVLIVHGNQASRLRTRFGDGGGSTPLRELVTAGVLPGVDAVVVTPKQTAGKATLLPLNRAYLRIYLTVDLRNDEIVNPGRDRVVSTWNAIVPKARNPTVVIERTGIA